MRTPEPLDTLDQIARSLNALIGYVSLMAVCSLVATGLAIGWAVGIIG